MHFPKVVNTIAIVSLMALSACSGTSSPASNPSSSSNSTSPSQGKIKIVASTNVWGSLASAIGGNLVEVKSIITNPNQDPHSYEATAKDKKEVKEAKIALINGGGYDDWATKLIASISTKPTVINAVKVSGLKKEGEKEFNEHVFFSAETSKKVAKEITAALKKIDPANQKEFDKNEAAFEKSIDKILDNMKKFNSAHPGMTTVATEPVVGYLLADLGIKDVTPPEFAEQSESDAGPSAQVVAKTTKILTSGKAKMLVLNGQTEDEVSKKLLSIANSKKIPVVKVYETFPEGITSYSDFLSQTIKSFEDSLKH